MALAELPIRAHRVERDEQLGLEQALRRDRRAPRPGVKAVELGRNGRKRRVGQLLHRPEGMIGWNPGVDREVVKHRGLGIDFTAHRCCVWGSGIRLGQEGGRIVHWVLHRPVRRHLSD